MLVVVCSRALRWNHRHLAREGLLKSLEELLYEAMVMLVFFPRTLWLTLRHPQRMMDYADTEIVDVQSEQYSDTLSPPLFLMSCLLLSHLVELAIEGVHSWRLEPFEVEHQGPTYTVDTLEKLTEFLYL